MRYVPRRAKVVNVLAVRQVKQGTETTRFRTDSTPHPCQYVHTSVTRAYGRDFASTVEMLKYSPAL